MKTCSLFAFVRFLLLSNLIFQAGAFGQTILPEYQVIDLGSSESYSVAAGINKFGQVVGYGQKINGNYYGFLWSNGSMRDLGTLGGRWSAAYGINDYAQVVGTSILTNGEERAFLYSEGRMQDLGLSWSGARGINNSSQVVGHYSVRGAGEWNHAFVWSNGTMHDLGTLGGLQGYGEKINNLGQVVGYSSIDDSFSGYHPFLYSDGIMHDLLSGTNRDASSSATCINDSGQVVGYLSEYMGHNVHGFIYLNGRFQDLGGGANLPWGINNSGQVVGGFPFGVASSHAFLWLNNTFYDLNNLVNTNISPGWVLYEATAINDSGQIVGQGRNPLGRTHAFLLNPLPAGWRQAITNQTTRLTFGVPPLKQTGKNNLIVITHGYIPFWQTSQESTAWVDSMSNSISQFLTAQGLNNWQVAGHKWIQGAEIPLLRGGPQTALANAKQDGKKLGESMASDGWSHIHFISHSAGAGVIQSASEAIKSSASSATTVHCTFLDPFVGLGLQGIDSYGSGANWSEQYFSHDLDTVGGSVYKVTESLLAQAYNVNVTQLNKVRELGAFVSAGNGVIEPCYRTATAHGWAVDFYSNTITGNVTSQYQGFGFPLSKEGGNWNYATNSYVVGNNPAQILGTPDATCISYATLSPQALLKVAISQSSTFQDGDALKYFNGLRLTTHSPSWLSTVVLLTNAASFVSFDAQFTSTNGAEGLLSIYWDTNLLGSLDERAVQSGFQHYTFAFPVAQANSTHMLGFRIDPFTNVQSSVLVTNIILGLSSVSQPFSLSVTTNFVGSKRVLELKGQAGINYVVEGSTNLINWEAVALLVNTNGVVRFYDQSTNNFKQRFYRAVAPY